jgi:hypothetical protein
MAAAHYWPLSGGFVYRLEHMFASEISFDQIEDHMPSYLNAWADFVARYTIDMILTDGHKSPYPPRTPKGL